MGLLEQNLLLGLEAAKYAKIKVTRSANQTYFKPWRPDRSKRRNLFLLRATRGGTYYSDEDESIQHDTVKSGRRKQLANVIKSTTMSKKQKEAKIDEMIDQWGERYFSGNYTRFAVGQELGVSDYALMARTLGASQDQIKDIIEAEDEDSDFLMKKFETAYSAHRAEKFGVGNCHEKAELAALYLIDQSPGGIRLALYSLDSQHKGVTGRFSKNGGGDHVFAVYGHTGNSTSVSGLGPDAIIVDGWMNDAYPARKHLAFKHGYNYDNVRISLKQLTVRNMVCISYNHHIGLLRDFGVLSPGRGFYAKPTVTRNVA